MKHRVPLLEQWVRITRIAAKSTHLEPSRGVVLLGWLKVLPLEKEGCQIAVLALLCVWHSPVQRRVDQSGIGQRASCQDFPGHSSSSSAVAFVVKVTIAS